MNLLIQYAIAQCGIPYKWGGNNSIEGFDCSGLVQWILKAAGVDPPGDQTAQALFDHFEKNGSYGTRQAGSLAFYGSSVTEITHVGWCIDAYRMIEAGGGDRLTLTRDDAAQKGACVRMRLIDSRSDLVAVIRPFYQRIGLI